jgi:hypothetical protein
VKVSPGRAAHALSKIQHYYAGRRGRCADLDFE